MINKRKTLKQQTRRQQMPANKTNAKRFWVVLIFSCFFLSGGATIRYVNQAGLTPYTDAANATSWTAACPDLQAVINASAVGDTVFVAAGTYIPTHSASGWSATNPTDVNADPNDRDNAFVLKAGVKIFGGFPATGEPVFGDRQPLSVHPDYRTILSGNLNDPNDSTDNAYHVVIGAGILISGNDTARFDGFTVTGGYSTGASGDIVLNNGYVRVYRYFGGGICLINCGTSIIMKSLRIINNTAGDNGGGIYCDDSAPLLSYAQISGNAAKGSGNSNDHGGGGIYLNLSSPKLTNVLISGNTADNGYGGGICNFAASIPQLTNVTVAGNYAFNNGGVYFSASDLQARNSIIWGNRAQSGNPNINNAAATIYSYSLVEGYTFNGISGSGAPGSPQFVNHLPASAGNPVIGGDYTLTIPGSAAIDKGVNSYNTLYTDFAGNVRRQGCKVDLGAYESQSLYTVVPSNDSIVYVKTQPAGRGDGSSWENAYGGLADPLAAASIMYPCIKRIWVAEGTYYPTRAADNLLNEDPDNRDNAFVLVPNVKIYGGFPDNASSATHDSIGDRAWVDSALFSSGNTLVIKVPLHKTILSGDLGADNNPANNVRHVVVGAGSLGVTTGTTIATVLDGFTITGAYSEITDADVNNNILVNVQNVPRGSGGGIALVNCGTSLALENLTITDNTVINGGGGIYNSNSAPVTSNVIISGNDAGGGNGGGIYNGNYSANSLPKLTKVQITGNTANNGGGVFNSDYASPEMNNVQITDNTVNKSGGGIYNQGSSNNLTSYPKLTNVLIAGNKAVAGNGGGMYTAVSANPTLVNVQITGNTASVGDGGGIYSAPAFMMTNVTVSGNHANSGGGVHFGVIGALQARNSVIWGNTAVNASYPNVNHPDDYTHHEIYSYSLTEGMNAITAPNVIYTGDPLFNVYAPASAGTPTSGGDYRLSVCSPAIDIGNNNHNSTAEDLNGNYRKINLTIDLGAYEGPAMKSDANGILYVKETGCGDGSSWEKPYPGLGDPLLAARENKGIKQIKQIWVAAGTYYPTRSASATSTAFQELITPDVRENSFVLVPGVKLYGGFPDSASTAHYGSIENRDWADSVYTGYRGVNPFIIQTAKNKAILSGDLGIKGDSTDNSYNVVIGAGNLVKGADTALMDGFTITGGQADNYSYTYNVGYAHHTVNGERVYQYAGAGMYLSHASPILKRLEITRNNVVGLGQFGYGGGGILCEAFTPPMSDILITNNTAKATSYGIGGGICYVDHDYYANNLSFEMTNVLVSGNSTSTTEGMYSVGGGIFFGLAKLKLTNVIIRDNHTESKSDQARGGGIYTENGTLHLTNVKVSNNTATGTANVSGGGISGGNVGSSLTKVEINGNTATATSGTSVGGGIVSSAMMNDVIISNNKAISVSGGSGGGIYLTGRSVITNATISGNTATSIVPGNGGSGGGIFFYCSGACGTTNYDYYVSTLTNVVITGNTAYAGAGIYSTSMPFVLTNSTVSGNRAYSYGGIALMGATNAKVRNSIIWGNIATSYAPYNNISSLDHANYFDNLIGGQTVNGTSVVSNDDPLFVAPVDASLAPTSEGDYRLKDCSPAINLGVDSLFDVGQTPDLSAITTDRDGVNARIIAPHVDLGAYESLSTMGRAVAEDVKITGDTVICSGTKAVLTAQLSAVGITNNIQTPNYKWYSSQTAPLHFYEGDAYTTSALTADTVFYISVSGTAHCENLPNKRKRVTVTVNYIPAVPNITAPNAICADDKLIMTTPSPINPKGSPVTTQSWQLGDTYGDNFGNIDLNNYIFTFADTNRYIRYRATNICGNGYSNMVRVRVNDKPTVANLGSIKAACADSLLILNAPQITENGAAVTVQGWEMEGSTPGIFHEFDPSTPMTSAHNGKQIKYYATNVCGTGYSVPMRIIVYPDLNGGAIEANQDICYGAAPMQLTGTTDAYGGNGAFAYLWQYSVNSVWLSTDSINKETYTPEALTVTTYYRRMATNSCGTTYSDTVTITVHDKLSQGAAHADTAVCYNTAPGTLLGGAVSGGTKDGVTIAYSYQWQHNITNGGWTDIQPDGDTPNYDPPTLKQTTQYRRIVSSYSGACGRDTSNVLTVKVYPQAILNYPDLRLWACPVGTSGNINLSKFIDTVELKSKSWKSIGSPYINPSTGIIDAYNLVVSKTYTYTYTVTNPCITAGVTRRVYLKILTPDGSSLRMTRDTIAICYDNAEALQINQIFGIEAGGGFTFSSDGGDPNPYVKISNSPAYDGATVMNGKGIYEDNIGTDYPWHGIPNTKKVTVTYTPDPNTCLGGKTYTVVIILTPSMI